MHGPRPESRPGGRVDEQLRQRGHTCGLRRDGSEPVRWQVEAADTERVRVGLRLNYRL